MPEKKPSSLTCCKSEKVIFNMCQGETRKLQSRSCFCSRDLWGVDVLCGPSTVMFLRSVGCGGRFVQILGLVLNGVLQPLVGLQCFVGSLLVCAVMFTSLHSHVVPDHTAARHDTIEGRTFWFTLNIDLHKFSEVFHGCHSGCASWCK